MTTQQTVHTPYDAEIVELRHSQASGWSEAVIQLGHKRQGYLRAKAEDADLREAVRMLLDNAPGTPQYEFARKTAREALEGRPA